MFFIAITLIDSFQPHKLPDWIQHVSSHLFIHQDLVFLHHQASCLSLLVVPYGAPPPLFPPNPSATVWFTALVFDSAVIYSSVARSTPAMIVGVALFRSLRLAYLSSPIEQLPVTSL